MRQDGDTAEPYHELVTRFQSRLYAFICTLVAGDADASDVLQETNVVLWEKASSFTSEANQCSFAAWAYRIAHYQVLAFRKRQQQHRRLVFSDELVSTMADEFQAESGEFDSGLDSLQECLGQLSAANRMLIRQRYEHRISVSELAQSLGRKASAVSASLYRIRKALLECLERKLGEKGI